MNRTLLEILNSMLHDNEVPPGLWAEALQTAVYLRNRVPTSAHTSGKTAFEFWTGRSPYIAVTWIHVPVAVSRAERWISFV